MQSDTIYNLKIDLLIPNPNQPRKQFNEISLNELASSIKTYGILNPILVRKKENMYEIIAGERRYRAAKIAGLTEIPAIIKNVDENKMSEIAIIENIQRENINPIEEAKSYQEILNKKNITESELSELLGKSQPFISNKIRLLNLQLDIQEALINKKISEKHARSLLKIKNEAQQIALLKRIINEKLSVKDLDKIIDNDKTNKQREEKESDNMNNGNFFPNYNNQESSNNMTLNSMNIQSMNNNQFTTMPQANTMPTTGPIIQEAPNISNFNDQVISNDNQNQQPNLTKQIITSTTNNNDYQMANGNEPVIPAFNVNETQSLNQTANPMPAENANLNMTASDNSQPANHMVDIPLFSEPNFNNQSSSIAEQNITETQLPNMVDNSQANINVPEHSAVPDAPLFNQELNNMPVQTSNEENTNLNESFYEVPVNISPVIEDSLADKVIQVQQLLSSNGIEYKTYSNESGHCIIIEL